MKYSYSHIVITHLIATNSGMMVFLIVTLIQTHYVSTGGVQKKDIHYLQFCLTNDLCGYPIDII